MPTQAEGMAGAEKTGSAFTRLAIGRQQLRWLSYLYMDEVALRWLSASEVPDSQRPDQEGEGHEELAPPAAAPAPEVLGCAWASDFSGSSSCKI